MEVQSPQLKQQIQSSAPDTRKRVLIIIPFGVPGSGKSFVWDAVKAAITKDKSDWSYAEISSDDMRSAQMEKLMQGSDLTRDAAFNATMKTGPKLYSAKLDKMIKAAAEGDSKTHVIFLDKNHPSNALDKLIT